MKNLKGHIFGLLVVLCGVLSLDGMFSSRFNKLNPRQLKQLSPRTISSSPSSQSIGSEVPLGDQRRSDVRVQYPSSWLENIQSVFWPKPKKTLVPVFLAPKVVTLKEIEALLEATGIAGYNRKTKEHIMLFSEDDLNRAKRELGYVINGNPEAKSNIIEIIDNGNGEIQSLTILDKVLYRLSQVVHKQIVLAPKSMSNYVELIKFLMLHGAEINTENNETYKQLFRKLVVVYRAVLDKYYRRVSKASDAAISMYWKVALVENLLTDLMVIFEKLIPGFKGNPNFAVAEHEKAKSRYKRYQTRLEMQQIERLLNKPRTDTSRE